jgi:hypothetical protein
MYAGKILKKHSLRELEAAGAGISRLLDAATGHSKVKLTEEPIVVGCWSTMISHPNLTASRAAPLVVLGLPESMSSDVDEMVRSSLQIQVVEETPWAQRLTCLEMSGQENVVRLRCDALLPVMRNTAIGSLLFIVVCGDDVLLVEYQFDRRTFLEICHELHQDILANGYSASGLDDDWQSERLVGVADGTATFLPLVYELDDNEEFYYGVVVGDESY